MAAVKVVVKVDLHNDTRKRKAIKAVSTLCGIDQIVVDMKDDKMTVVGTVDPVAVVRKLRRCFCCTVHIVSVAPAKEEEKKEEVSVGPAKAEEKKKKDDGGDKDANTLVPVPVCVPCYPSHWYYPPPHHQRPCCFVYTEEDPYACVIC